MEPVDIADENPRIERGQVYLVAENEEFAIYYDREIGEWLIDWRSGVTLYLNQEKMRQFVDVLSKGSNFITRALKERFAR